MFPDTLNDVLEKQLRKGDFIDSIFYCPYDIHELVTEEHQSEILRKLNEEHKELLFLCAFKLFSPRELLKYGGGVPLTSASFVARCEKYEKSCFQLGAI